MKCPTQGEARVSGEATHECVASGAGEKGADGEAPLTKAVRSAVDWGPSGAPPASIVPCPFACVLRGARVKLGRRGR